MFIFRSRVLCCSNTDFTSLVALFIIFGFSVTPIRLAIGISIVLILLLAIICCVWCFCHWKSDEKASSKGSKSKKDNDSSYSKSRPVSTSKQVCSAKTPIRNASMTSGVRASGSQMRSPAPRPTFQEWLKNREQTQSQNINPSLTSINSKAQPAPVINTNTFMTSLYGNQVPN